MSYSIFIIYIIFISSLLSPWTQTGQSGVPGVYGLMQTADQSTESRLLSNCQVHPVTREVDCVEVMNRFGLTFRMYPDQAQACQVAPVPLLGATEGCSLACEGSQIKQQPDCNEIRFHWPQQKRPEHDMFMHFPEYLV